MMRSAKDGQQVAWILNGTNDSYEVLLTNDVKAIYPASQLPDWMVFLYENGIKINGREFEENEKFVTVGEEYEISEILYHASQGYYLIRYRGFDMSEAAWVPRKDLKNCSGLLLSYHEEVAKNAQIGKITPTQNWLCKQGTGSRMRSITKKRNESKKNCDNRTYIEKNRARIKREEEKISYKQSCLYDAIDAEFPGMLPKSSSKYLRNATKREWCNLANNLQKVLTRFDKGICLHQVYFEEGCSAVFSDILLKFKFGVFFVLYICQGCNHCGIWKNGHIKPYVLEKYARETISYEEKYVIDYQENFRQVQNCVPAKVLIFSLKHVETDGIKTTS